MSAVPNNACEKALARKGIAQTHGTPLAKSSDKNSLANTGVVSFYARLFPVLDLIRNVLIDNVHTLLYFVQAVPLLLGSPTVEDFDIVPARTRCTSIDGYWSDGSMEQLDSGSLKDW